MNAVSAMMFLCDQDNKSATASWSQFIKAHPCMAPSINLVDSPDTNEHSYHYIAESEKKVTALSLSPGLEFLCKHKTGAKANANKEKFLGFIHSFKQQYAVSSGPDLGKRASCADLQIVASTESQHVAKIQKVLQVTLARNVSRVTSHVDGAVKAINADINNIYHGVTGVGDMQVKIQDEVKKVSKEVKKGNQVSAQTSEFLQQQLWEAQAANERQRHVISELNKQIRKQQSTPETANERLIIATLDSLKKDVAILKTNVATIMSAIAP